MDNILRRVALLVALAHFHCSTRPTLASVVPLQPLGHEGIRIDGANRLHNLGYSLGYAGDVNGDSYDDALLGTPNMVKYGKGAGCAYLVFGGPESLSYIQMLSPPPAARVSTLIGDNSGEMTGQAVAGAGDLNGDSFSDFIVGAPEAQGVSATNLAGKAYVVFGHNRSWPSELRISILNGTTGFIVEGVEASMELGSAVTGVGDINGDRLSDIAVAGWGGNGVILVIFGSRQPWQKTVRANEVGTTVAGFVIVGETWSYMEEASLGRAGDVNGDDFDDFLVGIPHGSPLGRSEAGETFLIFGRERWVPQLTLPGNATAMQATLLAGQMATENTGMSVRSAGDFNADGIDDFIVGTHTFKGCARIVFGRNDSWPPLIDFTTYLDGSTGFGICTLSDSAPWLGWFVDGRRGSDANGDGIDDVLIAPRESALLLYGSREHWPRNILLTSLNSSAAYTVYGLTDVTVSCLRVAIGGDFDGDRFADPMLGTPFLYDQAGGAFIILSSRRNASDGASASTSSKPEHSGSASAVQSHSRNAGSSALPRSDSGIGDSGRALSVGLGVGIPVALAAIAGTAAVVALLLWKSGRCPRRGEDPPLSVDTARREELEIELGIKMPPQPAVAAECPLMPSIEALCTISMIQSPDPARARAISPGNAAGAPLPSGTDLVAASVLTSVDSSSGPSSTV